MIYMKFLYFKGAYFRSSRTWRKGFDVRATLEKRENLIFVITTTFVKLSSYPYFVDTDESIIHIHRSNYNKQVMF
jgi:hypothetical protein